MIEIKKKLRHLLIPAQKALITTSVYDELDPKDAESIDMELHGKFFITINNPSTYLEDARIAILRKRKLGE